MTENKDVHYSIYGPGQGLDEKHDEIVNTITSVMYQSVMTREDLEDMLGQRISDLQWDRVHTFLHNKAKQPQNTIDVVREEVERNYRNQQSWET